MLQEQSYGAKEKSDTYGRDLLTLLIRANLQDSDGMNDLDVRAREGSPLSLPTSQNNQSFPQKLVPSSSLAMKRLAPPCRGHFLGFAKTLRRRGNYEKSF